MTTGDRITRRWRAGLLLLALLAGAPAFGQILPQHDTASLRNGFERYRVLDRFDRLVNFYLSVRNGPAERLPLVVFIQGSGCSSVFRKCGDNICGGYQNPLRQVVGGNARVLVVEKPGVRYLDDGSGGAAEGCSQEFLEEHTLSRWVEAIGAAVRAARTLPEIDSRRTLLIGHSEGGIVAAHVAAADSSITHVASLSAGGPTQLFDFMEFARQRDSASNMTMTEAEIHEAWRDIRSDPNSTSRFFAGHPYRRWSTFMTSSVLDGMLRTRARLYIVHGTEDAAVPVTSFRVLHAELLARHRDVTADLVEGGHDLNRANERGADGMTNIMTRIRNWFGEGE